MTAFEATFDSFAKWVEAESRAGLARCLQCQKCSSGCPVSARADIRAHELVRLVQLGRRDEVLSSRMIWECTSCHTCGTRCPQQVDIAAMNDTLRHMSRHARTAVPMFNRLFLRSVRRRGRVFELGLMVSFKLRTMRLFEDVGKFPMMLMKGKLSLLPRRRARGGEIERIFSRTGGAKP